MFVCVFSMFFCISVDYVSKNDNHFILFFLGIHCFHCSIFFKQEMELSLVGLQNAGKTALVNSIAVSAHVSLHYCSLFSPKVWFHFSHEISFLFVSVSDRWLQ